MSTDLYNLLFALFVLVIAVALFVFISHRLRKGGGSLTTTLLGTTYLFYDKEGRKAVEYLVERKAGKKQVEQSSEEPDAEE